LDILLDDFDISGRLFGFDLDPLFDEGQAQVYVAVATVDDVRLLRFDYEISGTNGALFNAQVLMKGLPKNSDHVSGMVKYGFDDKLYMSYGDLFANHASRQCFEIQSQYLPTEADINNEDYDLYQGKMLRINLDGSIPDDNPLFDGVKSHIYTIGHRNAQGLVFGTNNQLYSSEHGPATDDEINMIIGGKNYGWPHVAGFQDDINYSYCNRSSSPTCGNQNFNILVCPDDAEVSLESEWSSPEFQPPLASMFVVEDAADLENNCSVAFICRPGVAPSSIEYYEEGENGVPGWGKSLLVSSLKKGSVFRYELNEDGTEIINGPFQYFNTVNRYRDIVAAPDNRTFYVLTDNGGNTLNADGTNSTSQLANAGRILKFEWIDSDEIFEIQIDTSVCEENVIVFGGAELTDEGTYVKVFESMNGLDSTVTLNLSYYEAVSVDLGEDQEVIQGEVLLLDAGEGFSSYLWNTGDTTQTIQANTAQVGTYVYSATTTDENGCEGADEVNVLVKTLLATAEKSKLQIYPNPANRYFEIQGFDSEISRVRLIDLSGNSLQTWTEVKSGRKLALDSFSSGIYLIEVSEGSVLRLLIK
jgi:PQQ-dependent dehydrogenase (s-GDH family)